MISRGTDLSAISGSILLFSQLFPGEGKRNFGIQVEYFTKRWAPITPAEFVEQVNQTVRGWADYFRHTNASEAFRRLQRFINIRFRRYLNYRSKGRGFGWKKYPNAALYAEASFISGVESSNIRVSLCMLCDEDCRTAGFGKTERLVAWEGNGEPVTTGLVRHCVRGNPQKQIGRV